jgi:hypothetical protein
MATVLLLASKQKGVIIMLLPRYFIIGGYLKVHKSVFVKEMLCSDSRIKALLNWKNSEGLEKGHPVVSEPGQDGIVTINFSNSCEVDIGESPDEILGYLKSKYSNKIKGKISCRSSISFFEIDLNADNDELNYVIK